MSSFNAAQWRKINDFVHQLGTCRRVHDVARVIVTELPTLIGSDQTTWNFVSPTGGTDVMAWPEQDQHEKHEEALAHHVADHPLLCNFLTTSDPTAYKLSDFLSRRDFHNTALYDDLYCPLGYEDQFALHFGRPGNDMVVVVVARDRRTFRDCDRALLNLLRPHLERAWRHATTVQRLLHWLEAARTEVATARIVLNRQMQVTQISSRARRWLAYYFAELPRAPNQLPAPLHDWLTEQLAFAVSTAQRDAGVFHRQVGRRALRVADDDGSIQQGELALLLYEQPMNAQANDDANVALLTARQFEVLHYLAQGLRNRQIATSLGITPRTVKKHLENIFRKLGVENRTAAVALFHAAHSAK